MSRIFYNIISLFLFPLFLIFIFFRLFSKPGFKKGLAQRFGIFSTAKLNKPIWVHCVSVGELNGAMPLINELAKKHGKENMFVTTTTVTGMQILKERIGGEIAHSFLPYDFLFLILPFVMRVKPRALIVMETELWPNLLFSCSRNHYPVIVANARLSERSFNKYLRFSGLASLMMNDLSRVVAVSDADGHRFIQLGLPVQDITICSNMKSDIQYSELQLDAIQELRKSLSDKRAVIVAGSTHDGEEAIILRSFKECLKAKSDALLIIAPRHPKRFGEVAKLAKEHGLSVENRSESELPSNDTQVFIVDTLGELVMFYGAGHIAFVGGSLIDGLSGHNPLEPASLAVPVISGKQIFAFEQPFSLLCEAGGALIVDDEVALTSNLIELLNHPEKAVNMGSRAQSCQMEQSGSVDIHVDIISNEALQV